MRWAMLLGLWAFVFAVQAGVVVVVPGGVEQGMLNQSEVRDIYLGLRKATDAGVLVRPYVSADEEVQQQLGEQLLGISAVAYKAHWARMVFAGNGRPPRNLTFAEMGALVPEEPVPLVCVDARAVPAGWRVVFSGNPEEP